ncbi:hypothetical protein M569_05216 [Genlisea aurea]|uniref:S-protein homolog n=1 Tax=Genlisea aurea TaxID=192259 RepID=S8CX50_9LAMI|nr:hypothetical protein M569_05216 [Genlisea aurea]
MGNSTTLKILAAITAVIVLVLCFVVFSFGFVAIMPEVEVTIANDGASPVLFMCQLTDKSDSLYTLKSNVTYIFHFTQIAFPMRWCFLYINPNTHGFFWAYTVRSRCTKCFWSVTKHVSLYRGDKGRWERQKLFMPPDFSISDYRLDKKQVSST